MSKAFSLLFIFLFFSFNIQAQVFTATTANPSGVYEQTPPTGSGLNSVFMFYNAVTPRISYTSPNENSVINWYSYEENPAERIAVSSTKENDSVSYITNISYNKGYIVTDGNEEYAIWVINYNTYSVDFDGLDVIEKDNACEYVYLQLTGNVPEITYYTFPNGNKASIPRSYTITYNTMQWNRTDKEYKEILNSVEFSDLDIDILSEIRVRAPLMDTTFEIAENDEFAEFLNAAPMPFISEKYETKAIEIQVEAEIVDRDNQNEKDPPGIDESGKYTGSAPIVINFICYATEAARHFSWEFSAREDFSVLLASYPDQELTYTFNQSGTTYVRMVASDYRNECSVTAPGEPFIITTSESFIDAPNYFSPNSSSGVNDEFKVVYKSIAEFKCTIFNRWGNQIYQFTDPAEGWDGKKDGKLVPPGVYFYVIEAKGTDGMPHKLKGDINLIYDKRFSEE
ncbi:MAG: gliding motility-associated C-terminal domain-containing protein [Candidatus Azobacteroides sp.]|nr:gliding motility-associated C-terminal domain-containing protein [Candidatus Azobacteroides sp.]